MKKKLAETSPFLRDPKVRALENRQQALDSSVFEGARGLKARQPRKNGRSTEAVTASKKKSSSAV